MEYKLNIREISHPLVDRNMKFLNNKYKLILFIKFK